MFFRARGWPGYQPGSPGFDASDRKVPRRRRGSELWIQRSWGHLVHELTADIAAEQDFDLGRNGFLHRGYRRRGRTVQCIREE